MDNKNFVPKMKCFIIAEVKPDIIKWYDNREKNDRSCFLFGMNCLIIETINMDYGTC